jgi:lathosterol oxidase
VGPPYSQSFPYLEKWARLIVNGPAHHTDHHLFFTFNYGQYTTLWDRIGGTYMEPTTFLGKGPGDEVRKSKKL